MAREFNEYRDEKKPKEVNHGHGKCEVYGCDRWGHIYQTNWNCRYHHNRTGEDLAKITTILRNHEPEINWYELVLGSRSVDWECLGLKERAPVGLEPVLGEKFEDYRDKMHKYIDRLTRRNSGKMQANFDKKPETEFFKLGAALQSMPLDRKSMASGEVE